ncbi:MAG: protein translocase subunit SecF [Deltaproteobacteria bacterium]|nr:protein translocase subunit SecF [Deltaproteobacteria bacterium]
MRFIKPDINIGFIAKRKIGFAVSCIMILLGIASLIIKGGPRLGIDFAGGTVIQIKFEKSITLQEINDVFEAINFDKSSVQEFGDKKDKEFLIRANTEITDEEFGTNFQNALKTFSDNKAEIRRVEAVGPQIGKELREKALFAIFFVILFITVYISGRFELKWILSGVVAGALMGAVYGLSLFKTGIPILILAAFIISLTLFWLLRLKYAMGAVAALIHDVIITVGIFSILDKDFTLPIIAALLTIIGYSLNDTIIVFDRIRENLKKNHKESFENIINKSVNETLSRTILTSFTTLLVLTSLFIFGGGIIHDFAFAMIIGVLVGTYSSIFVASPILIMYGKKSVA